MANWWETQINARPEPANYEQAPLFMDYSQVPAISTGRPDQLGISPDVAIDMNVGGINNISGAGGGPTGPTFGEKFFGSKEYGPGWGKTVLGTGLGLGQLWLGKEQLDLAKKSLATSKKQFADQFGMQKQLVNQDIMSKARAQEARGGTQSTSAQDYYDKNKLNF